MSSDDLLPEISSHEMEMIRSVLRVAGYSPDVLVEDRQNFNTATLLLIKLVLSGEASPYALAEQLERAFGRPPRDKALFASILPRYATQGLPRMRKTAFHPTGKRLRSGESDLREWENEIGTPNPVSRHRLVH